MLIAWTSRVYFRDDNLPAFVVEKLPLAHEDLFFVALRLHVVAACLALPGCLALLSSSLLRRAPRLHRWLGRAVGAVLLLVAVPSGVVLAFSAKGGAWGTAGFLLTAAITALAMTAAIQTARARRFVAHHRWSSHVLAQLSVAVSSRVLLVFFDAAGLDAVGLDEEAAYLLALWGPVVGSALAVEVLLPRAAGTLAALTPSPLAPRLVRGFAAGGWR
jgi:hypothetical protein